MSVLPSMPSKAIQEAQTTEVPEPDRDSADSVFPLSSSTESMSDETFEEELLRDAYLPKDRKP